MRQARPQSPAAQRLTPSAAPGSDAPYTQGQHYYSIGSGSAEGSYPLADETGHRGTGAKRMLLMVAVMTVHSAAEGVAVGVSFGGTGALAAAITIAIAVHNVPEGLAITAVMRPRGVSLVRCAGWSVFSSLPQPLLAVPAFLFVQAFAAALPYGLGFAAGAMMFMVFEELLPEAYGEAPRAAVAALASLFLVAMVVFQRYL